MRWSAVQSLRSPRRWLVAAVLPLMLVAALAGQEADGPLPAVDEPVDAGLEADELDRILADEDEMLAGQGYSYDPGNRRDPFKSLLAARARPVARGPRPDGIPGLLIDEIDLTGVFVMPDGPVAQIHSADRNESYLLRVGDQLYDGDVIGINEIEVAFRQIVDDPTAIKPFRDVVKQLNP